MKRILNRKTVIEASGGGKPGVVHVLTIYRMERIVDGQPWRLTVPVLPEELETARGMVAYRLREARRTLERMVAIAAQDTDSSQGEQHGSAE